MLARFCATLTIESTSIVPYESPLTGSQDGRLGLVEAVHVEASDLFFLLAKSEHVDRSHRVQE